MHTARRRVLNMLYEQRLKVHEAEELLELMEREPTSVEAAVPRPQLIGHSQWKRQFLRNLERLAGTHSPVLIQGEPGTGKALIAQMLHYQSPRAAGPFVQVPCAGVDALVGSELFGHEEGAFTGAVQQRAGKVELARGGTLLLGEVEKLSAENQARLVHLLEERAYERLGGVEKRAADVRLVAATEVDLKERVEAGKFRADLYYGLSVAVLQTAPLRECREDIPALVQYFLEKKAERDGGRVPEVSEEAMRLLCEYAWPGNAAQLAHAVERAANLCAEGAIGPEHLPELAGG